MIKEKNHPDLILTDHLMIHFLELPKFDKNTDFNTPFEKWMAFFKYEGKGENQMETILKDDEILNKAHQKYLQFTQNDELMEIYEARLKWQLDHNTAIISAREEGGHLKAINIAKALKKEGFSLEKTQRITGLSLDDDAWKRL